MKKHGSRSDYKTDEQAKQLTLTQQLSYFILKKDTSEIKSLISGGLYPRKQVLDTLVELNFSYKDLPPLSFLETIRWASLHLISDRENYARIVHHDEYQASQFSPTRHLLSFDTHPKCRFDTRQWHKKCKSVFYSIATQESPVAVSRCLFPEEPVELLFLNLYATQCFSHETSLDFLANIPLSPIALKVIQDHKVQGSQPAPTSPIDVESPTLDISQETLTDMTLATLCPPLTNYRELKTISGNSEHAIFLISHTIHTVFKSKTFNSKDTFIVSFLSKFSLELERTVTRLYILVDYLMNGKNSRDLARPDDMKSKVDKFLSFRNIARSNDSVFLLYTLFVESRMPNQAPDFPIIESEQLALFKWILDEQKAVNNNCTYCLSKVLETMKYDNPSEFNLSNPDSKQTLDLWSKLNTLVSDAHASHRL